jgi:hypothetical protein
VGHARFIENLKERRDQLGEHGVGERLILNVS